MEQIAKDVGTSKKETGAKGGTKKKEQSDVLLLYKRIFDSWHRPGSRRGRNLFFFSLDEKLTDGHKSTRTIYRGGRERHVSNAIDDHYCPE
jgi:hypothetical protein